MAKKIKSKKTNSIVNLYEDAGWLELSKDAYKDAFKSKNIGSTITSIAGGLTGIAGSALNNAKLENTESIESGINSLANRIVSARNNTDLLAEWGNYSSMDPIERKDLVPSAGKQVMNTLSGVASGAAAGASVGGPWGAVAGGALGLLSGIGGSIYSFVNSGKKANEYNAEIEDANKKNLLAFQDKANNIDESNDIVALSNYFKDGGFTSTHGIDFTNGITKINNGGTHEQNPFEGIPMGMDNEGIPNLVEEGEVKYDNYIFSNRLKANKKLLSTYTLPEKYEDKTFADIAKILSKESEERPNDPISKRGLEDSMSKLQQAQEEVRMKKEIRKNKNSFAKGGKLGRLYNGLGEYPNILGGFSYTPETLMGWEALADSRTYTPTTVNNVLGLYPKTDVPRYTDGVMAGMPLIGVPELTKFSLPENPSEEDTSTKKSNWESWLRYAPVLGSALGLGLAHIKDKNPASDRLEEIAQSLRDVDYTPVGNYLTYRPLDRNYYINRKNAEAAATRNALMQSNSPSRNAALLAADYNNQIALGELYRQAEESNFNQRKAVEEFNRGTNTFNSEMALKAAMANQAQSKNRADLLTKQVVMEAEDKLNREKAISANATSLFDSIGDIGRESVFRQMIASNPSLLYEMLRDGRIGYKGNKDGGYLTIKKRRRG